MAYNLKHKGLDIVAIAIGFMLRASAASSLIGALSMLPGGIGGAETASISLSTL